MGKLHRKVTWDKKKDTTLVGYSRFFFAGRGRVYITGVYQALPGRQKKQDGVSACHPYNTAASPADATSLHHSAQCIHLSDVCPTWSNQNPTCRIS